MGIRGRLQRGGAQRIDFFARGFAIIERFESAAGAQGVDMPLCDHRVQPGLERAAAVKITKERALSGLAIRQTIKLCEERVGELLNFKRTRGTMQHNGSGGPQGAAKCGDEMLPGRLASLEARGGQREVLDVQGAEIFLEFCGGNRVVRETFLQAARERCGEALLRQAPASSRGLRIEFPD